MCAISAKSGSRVAGRFEVISPLHGVSLAASPLSLRALDNSNGLISVASVAGDKSLGTADGNVDLTCELA